MMKLDEQFYSFVCRVQGGRGSAKNERHRSEQKDITEGEIQRLRERLDDYKYRLQEKDKQIYDLSQRYSIAQVNIQNEKCEIGYCIESQSFFVTFGKFFTRL